MSSAAASAASPGFAVRLARQGDERLAQRVAAGDGPAFAAIYERYHQPLFRYCRSILRQDGDAQDALQSTFERAFSALQRSQRSAPLRPWLFRIAHNEAITVIRRRAADEPSEQLDTGIAPSAEHAAAERARLAVLLDDLADLPERPRGALVMRELGDLSHEEIALALEISVGAAKQAIFEARRALQECVEGRAMACEEVQRKLSDGDRRALRGRRVRAHMRDCAGCAAFATAIPERQAELRAVTPLLAPAAAAAIFARAAGSVHGAGFGAGAAGGGGLGVGAAFGKAGMATAAVSSKLATVAAIVATAAAGAGGVVAVAHLTASHGRSAPAARSHPSNVRSTDQAAPAARSASSAASSTGSSMASSTGSSTHRGARGAAARLGAAKQHARAERGAAATPSSPGRSSAAPGRSQAASRGAGANAVGAHRQQSRSHGAGQSRSPATTHTHHHRVVPNLRVPPTKAGGAQVMRHRAAVPGLPAGTTQSLAHSS